MMPGAENKMADDEAGRAVAATNPAAPVSFSFTRTLGRKRLLPGPAQDGSRTKEEPDFLSAVEGKELRSVRPAPQAKELVIPLIQKNQWKQIDGPAAPQPPEGDDGVESQAVREIIEESKKSQEQWESDTKVDPTLAIPLLLQNRVPDGYEERDKATEADYGEVPVDAYGMAMLKGMGWKAGEGIGRTFKQDVKPREHQLRPKGLGLGANRSAAKDLEPAGPRRPPKPGEERAGGEEEPMGLVPGAAVLIEAGPHKELYGRIEGVDPDNARAMVKLAIGGKIVTLSQHGLRPVTRKEYDKQAKDLSRLSQARKDREAEQRNGTKPSAEPEETRGAKEKDRKRKQPEGTKSDDHAGKQIKGSSNSSHRSSSPPHWLRRDLRVRFVDKLYKGGKYYNTKMVIEDVLSPDTCVCRTDEGRILDDIQEAMLETIIPRKDSDWIMVVLGENAGRVGRILRRDKDRSQALVQLQREEEGRLLTLDYDAVCHYVGGTEDD